MGLPLTCLFLILGMFGLALGIEAVRVEHDVEAKQEQTVTRVNTMFNQLTGAQYQISAKLKATDKCVDDLRRQLAAIQHPDSAAKTQVQEGAISVLRP